MTNSKTFKINKVASRRLASLGHVLIKIFIIMLCIIALLFLYSCQFRNNYTTLETPPPTEDIK